MYDPNLIGEALAHIDRPRLRSPAIDARPTDRAVQESAAMIFELTGGCTCPVCKSDLAAIMPCMRKTGEEHGG